MIFDISQFIFWFRVKDNSLKARGEREMIFLWWESSPYYLNMCLNYFFLLWQPKELVGVLVLLNQLICKFSTSVHEILDEVFPAIVSRIFSILPQDGFPCGPGSNTEVWSRRRALLDRFMSIFHLDVFFKVDSLPSFPRWTNWVYIWIILS